MGDSYNTKPEMIGANLKSLPRPNDSAGRGKAIFWALIALLALGCAIWWLTRKPEEKESLRDAAADLINEQIRETPLAGMGDILRVSPPPLPGQILNPPTEKGTLSGRVVEGTIASPLDMGGASAPGYSSEYATGDVSSGDSLQEMPGKADHRAPTATPQLNLANPQAMARINDPRPGSPAFSPTPLPPVQEDKQVPPTYLEELAQWLVARYKPGDNGGMLAVSVQNLNNLFGVKIARQAKGGRQGLLRYAFQPSMVQGLYDLYINRFMEDLDSAARKRGLDSAQSRNFRMALGGKAAAFALAMDGVVSVPDLKARLKKIDDLAQGAVELNSQMASAVFDLDELRAAKMPPSQINTAQMRIDGLAARYRRAISEYEDAKRDLAYQIRKNSGQSLDEDSLLYMAAWAQRRLDQDPDAAVSLKGCANVMRELSKRCARQ